MLLSRTGTITPPPLPGVTNGIDRRIDSREPPSFRPLLASVASGTRPPDVTVASRCGYGGSRRACLVRVLRYTSARTTSRNLLVSTIDEEHLTMAHSHVPSDPSLVQYVSSATEAPPAVGELVREVFPPQG